MRLSFSFFLFFLFFFSFFPLFSPPRPSSLLVCDNGVRLPAPTSVCRHDEPPGSASRIAPSGSRFVRPWGKRTACCSSLQCCSTPLFFFIFFSCDRAAPPPTPTAVTVVSTAHSDDPCADCMSSVCETSDERLFFFFFFHVKSTSFDQSCLFSSCSLSFFYLFPVFPPVCWCGSRANRSCVPALTTGFHLHAEAAEAAHFAALLGMAALCISASFSVVPIDSQLFSGDKQQYIR